MKLSEQDKLDINDLMDFDFGVRVIARILDYCGMNISSFNQDNAIMSFNEGRRDVGLHIVKMLEDEIDSLTPYEKKLYEANRYRQNLFDEDRKEESINGRNPKQPNRATTE